MINNNILNELLKTHDLTKLEQHLIYAYLISKKIDYIQSPILANYFENFTQDIALYYDISSLNIVSIKKLENYLELIIPISDRKLNGAFFTPEYIVNFIINELKPLIADKNLDPSCGCGAFLVGLVNYYKQNFKKSIKATIQENIFGSDILAYNIHRTKLILTIYALQNDEILEDNDFNLYHQDSLKANWNLKFDNILGNPPYIKFQDLTSDIREYLIKNWTTVDGGTFNIYFTFFELGYNLLTPKGKLGYITPNNYFTSLAGESLRKFFQQKKCVSRIIDFSHKKVFDAQTYTALTFLTKSTNESIMFDRIKDNYIPEDFLLIANGSPNYIKNLNSKKWRLLKSDEQKNIENIENIGTPIGELFDISVGIATLKDDVFFVDSVQEKNGFYIKNTLNRSFEIEKEITQPVYKISDFKTQKEIENNTKRIICPYYFKKGSATPIPESDFKNKYPKCYAYLLAEKEKLMSRDKGKTNFEPFYAWGRTQGLLKRGIRILNPTFSLNPRFFVIKDENSFFTNGYGIFFKEKNNDISLFTNPINPITLIENIDVVQKILNSNIMHYYITKTSVAIEGGYPCYQKNFIEKFTIPEFTIEEIKTIRNLVNPQDIDDFLADKYYLNFSVPNLSE